MRFIEENLEKKQKPKGRLKSAFYILKRNLFQKGDYNLNSKQRAYLRKLSNNIPALFQIGKLGINDNFITQINDALEARELIKISVLENSSISAKEAAQQISDLTKSEVVQVIGNKFVLYKQSKQNPTIVLP